MKRIISFILALCIMSSAAFAEENDQMSIRDSINSWLKQATKDTSDWAHKAWNDTSEWAGQVWDNASNWTIQAWNDASKWVGKAWSDSTKWAANNWNHFIVWINTISSGDPYSWLKTAIADNGILAYDRLVDLRSFLEKDPQNDEIHEKYNAALSELSILKEDQAILWNMLQDWSNENGIAMEQTAIILLPFLTRLVIEGETVIGDDVVLSGPVIGQYLLSVLEAIAIDSQSKAEMQIQILQASLAGLIRPTIIGDVDQNELVTDDKYCIEYFSYGEGKYQVFLLALFPDENSQYPWLRGSSLQQVVNKYFENATVGSVNEQEAKDGCIVNSIPFSYAQSGSCVSGKAVAIWTQKNDYLLFVVTDKTWDEEKFAEWVKSLVVSSDGYSISFEVDMESDGAFFGVNQVSQKYTINRIYDEEKFTVPMTGHGWAAERGNNLIDNLKGVFKGQHSTVIGDNNAKNGADRITTFADGTRLLIQTKYYSTASRSVSACFDENGFRYIDHVEGKPMAIEVPADQYEAALEYMRNRIANGEVQGVTDVKSAESIVKKGSLTYQQARHIAKAGTVESIIYDSAHACVTAGTSMGLSAAASFAVNLWNGESFEASIKESILQGLKSGGTSFIISVLSSQVAKSGINTAMIPASRIVVHALGPKISAVIVNAFRPAGSAIYGAAAMQSAAKLLRGNVITSTVTFAVLSAGDIADIIQGKISWKQLAKNMSTTAVAITGGALGYIGGAALGSALLPGAGSAVGFIVSVAAGWGASEGAKAVADLIAEDDADEMIHIIETQFPVIASEYFLNEEEVNQSIENIQNLITAEMLKQMYQYKDREKFARQLVEMSIDPVVTQREYVKLPSEDEYSEYLTDALEAIYQDINGDSLH